MYGPRNRPLFGGRSRTGAVSSSRSSCAHGSAPCGTRWPAAMARASAPARAAWRRTVPSCAPASSPVGVVVKPANGIFKLGESLAPDYRRESAEAPGVVFSQEHAAMAVHLRRNDHDVRTCNLRPKLPSPAPTHLSGMPLYLPSDRSASFNQMADIPRMSSDQDDPQRSSARCPDGSGALCL
jgi:hypothetical protein